MKRLLPFSTDGDSPSRAAALKFLLNRQLSNRFAERAAGDCCTNWAV